MFIFDCFRSSARQLDGSDGRYLGFPGRESRYMVVEKNLRSIIYQDIFKCVQIRNEYNKYTKLYQTLHHNSWIRHLI